MNKHIAQFKENISYNGLKPPEEIIADGNLHRYTVTGDKPRSDNGWYVFHPGNLAAGAFGCWKRQISQTWSGIPYQDMAPSEKTSHRAKMEAIKLQREEEQTRIQYICRQWCVAAWTKAKDATNENPYIRLKGVQAYGIKSFRDSLIIPVQDIIGAFHGMQFIAPDGSKRFKTGTCKTGNFFKIGTSRDKTIIVCEGYATGASIHQATGHAVVIAFDAGNLLPVAQGIRTKYPDMKIIIAADDDYVTVGNPGMTKGTEAARAVDGFLVSPVFQGVVSE